MIPNTSKNILSINDLNRAIGLKLLKQLLVFSCF